VGEEVQLALALALGVAYDPARAVAPGETGDRREIALSPAQGLQQFQGRPLALAAHHEVGRPVLHDLPRVHGGIDAPRHQQHPGRHLLYAPQQFPGVQGDVID